MQIAEERLLEIQAMGKKNKADAIEKAQEKHQEILEDVNETVEEFDGVEVDNETITGIRLGMQNHMAALAKVRAKIQANENIPEETRARLLEKIDGLEVRAQNLIQKIEAKKMIEYYNISSSHLSYWILIIHHKL